MAEQEGDQPRQQPALRIAGQEAVADGAEGQGDGGGPADPAGAPEELGEVRVGGRPQGAGVA